MQATITREKHHAHGSKFEWKWLYSVTLEGAKPVTIGNNLLEAEGWAKRHGASSIARNWQPNLPTRRTTNFKRRGRAAPASANRLKPTGAELFKGAIIVEGDEVRFADGYQRITLHCDGEQHAAIIARALVDGLVKFTSKAE